MEYAIPILKLAFLNKSTIYNFIVMHWAEVKCSVYLEFM